VLDAGAGFMPYRSRILLGADSYVSLDMEAAPGVDVLGDVTRMTDIADDTFDVVLCLEVLEHLSTPAAAASEIARVLRPGGTAIISVPHLSRIHDAPHDYFRFTRYGLSRIASDAGLTIDSVDDVGSVFSLLGHQLATLLAPLCWGVPILRWVAFAVATTLVTLPSIALDALPGLRALLPLNVVLVAHKSGPPTG
jgi:SAM-dependent methyltransferase